jgi:predicted nucleotidyltransferase
MSYSISSSKLKHPLLKPIFEELYGYFEETGIHFYVIGATARDIIMEIHNESGGRATLDLDIAIAISDWEQFSTVEKGLLELPNFTKDPKQKQRFIYKSEFQLDVVPYGKIMEDGDKIFWPPDEHFAMTILGFSEVEKATEQVQIDDGFTLNIASLAGIFVLKIFAWEERKLKGNKDADDIAFIIGNYYEIHIEKAVELNEEIYTDDFTVFLAGTKLLGKDVLEILAGNEDTVDKVKAIIDIEINLEEGSKLINQMIETNRLKYEEVLQGLKNILIELK